MTFDENTLRELLSSPYGQSCGLAVLETVENGAPVTITLKDGTILVLMDYPTALARLGEIFGWKPPQ